MKPTHRRIFKNQVTGADTLKELLQTMFVAEMLRPAGVVWIVSPWVSNVVLIDNRSGNFDALNPEWGRREVRLADVLGALMNRGSDVRIVTRNDESNQGFLARLREMAEQQSLLDRMKITIHDPVHTKGILLSGSLLMGSMNLTYNGMVINDEWVEFSVDREDVARTRLEFQRYPGHDDA
jgi:phosphatidylserine/phosphatidylglycerophosphate/cardiolipin synthase-like enzyme